MDIEALERSELKRAFKCAREVNQLMMQEKPTMLNRLQSDLADIALETIHCIQDNTLLHTGCLIRISRYLTMDKETLPLVKLGYALTVVIEKLMNDRSKYLTTSFYDRMQPSTSRPVPHLVDDSIDINAEPADIKEEPMDDYDDNDEVKQEELDEPEADVFCPSTGTSRPLGSSGIVQNDLFPSSQAAGVDEGDRVWVGMTSAMPLPMRMPFIKKRIQSGRSSGQKTEKFKKVYTVKSGPVQPIMKRVTLPTVVAVPPTTFRAPGQSKAPVQEKDGPIIRCYLCCANDPEKYETTPPFSQTAKRKKFLDKIVVGSVAGKARLDMLRRSHQTAHFCELHLAVPLEYKTVNKKSSCELCDQPKYPLSTTPVNPISRRRLLASLIKLSAAQQKKIAFLLENPEKRATFCSKHFPKYDAQREGAIQVNQIPAYLESLKHQHNTRKKALIAPASIPPIDFDILRATPVRIDVGYLNEAPVKEEPIPEPILKPIIEPIAESSLEPTLDSFTEPVPDPGTDEMASYKTVRQPAELRVAKDRALDVFESLRKQEAGSSLPMAESMLFLDLALLTVEAIECYNNYTALRPSSIINNARYAKCGGQSQIVKLGYSLSVVLNTLLNERKAASETIRSLTKQLAVFKAAEQLAQEQENASAEPPPALERVERQPSLERVEPSNDILFEETREIKEEPAEEWMEEAVDHQQLPGPSGVVKEEEMDLMEVKEEPLDDVVDVKKEMKEEPLADVYCPAKGTARPHEHADFDNFNDQQGQEIRMTGMRLQLSGREKVVIVRNSSGTIVERLPAAQDSPAGPSYIGRSRPCYLCGNFTDKYEALPPAGHKTKRADFLDRIILSTPAYGDRVQALRNSHITVYFCPSHIAAPTKAPTQFAKISIMASDKIPKKQRCALCSDSRSPLTPSPSNPITRRRFFNTLINLSAAEKKKADYFVAKNDVEVSICAKHFAKKHDMYASKDDKKRERQAYHTALKAGIIPSSIPRTDALVQQQAQKISLNAPIRDDSGNPNAVPKDERNISGTHYP